ncbi:MAG: hypothetical protein GYA47_12305 [Desulfovibrio sp.]|nr:hypothetical protein [Desulfovibrio sp.]
MAFSLALLAGFASLTVDYAFLRYTMNRLQKAAEDSALAGAAALIPLGADCKAARDVAVRTGQAVLDRDDSPDLAVRASDVLFLQEGVMDGSSPDQVEVTAGRTSARGNPVRLFLGGIMGQPFADVSANARAGLFCAGSSGDVAPLAIPERFVWDDACDADQGLRNNGVCDAQSPCETASLQVLGHGDRDAGRRIALRPGSIGRLSPETWYLARGGAFAAKGADRAGDETHTGAMEAAVAVADELRLDSGEYAAAWLRREMARRMGLDDGAYWDDSRGIIAGSRFRDSQRSPRLLRVAFFDPSRGESPGGEIVRVCRLGAFFIEDVRENGDVAGRFVRALAVSPKPAEGPCDPRGIGLYGARLVRVIKENRVD